MREFMTLRQLTAKHLPDGGSTQLSVGLFSPYMTFDDLKWFLTPLFNLDKLIETQDKLFDTLSSESGLTMYDYVQYEVPVVIIAGDRDWITPFRMAEDHYNLISAPKKDFLLIENAGHIPFMDEPKRFAEALAKALGQY